MNIKKLFLLFAFNLLATTAYAAEPLVFTSTPTIPSTIDQGTGVESFEYTIKNELSTDSLTLVIELLPGGSDIVSLGSGTCGETLAPKQSCTVIVDADTNSAGGVNQTLSITYSPRNAPLESPIAFAVIAPSTPSASLLFTALPDVPPQVAAGTDSSVLKYTIKNIGQQDATSVVVTLTGDGLVSVDSDSTTCVSTLAAGASCDLGYQIQTTTSTTPDTYNNLLSITYTGATDPLISKIDFEVIESEVVLAFQGQVPNPDIPSLIMQGDETNPFVYTIVNNGSTAATNVVVTITKDIDNPSADDLILATGTGDQCDGQTIAAGNTCTLTYKIATDATTAIGQYNNTLSIDYDGSIAPLQSQINFYVASPPSPILVLDDPDLPDNIIIGAAPPSKSSYTYTLTNVGQAVAQNITPSITDVDYGIVQLQPASTCGTPPFDLAVSTSCTLIYDIVPTVVGFSSQTLSVAYDDGVTPLPPVTTDINFTGVLANSPAHAYVADLFGATRVTLCSIDSSGEFTTPCAGAINTQVPGGFNLINSIGIAGNFAYLASETDGVANCALSSDLLNCSSASTGQNKYIAFNTLNSTLYGYLGTDLGRDIKLCTGGTTGSLTCTSTGPTFSFTLAITFAQINGNDYAYVLEAQSGNLYRCDVNSDGTLSATCDNLGGAFSLNSSAGLSIVSAGELYIYVPTNSGPILACSLDGDGNLGTCTTANNQNTSYVGGITASTINNVPYVYISLSALSTSLVQKCTIAIGGGLTCNNTGDTFNNPLGITLN